MAKDNGYNIKQICMTFITGNRFYATILAKLVKQPTNRIPTAAVGWTANGKLALFYNENFLKAQDIRDAQFVLTHEILHVFFRHLYRFDIKNMNQHERQIANVAMDMAINQLISEAPRKLPDGNGGEMELIYPDLYKDKDGKVFPDGKSAEFYLDLLKESMPPQNNQQNSTCPTCGGTGIDPNSQDQQESQGSDDNGQGQDGENNGEGQGSDDNGQGQDQPNPQKACPDCNGSGKCEGYNPHDQGGMGNTADSHDLWDKVINDDDQIGNAQDYDIDIEYETMKIVKESIQECRKFGKLPSFVEAEIEKLKKVVKRHNWKRELQIAVNSVRSNKTRFTQKRVNRRAMGLDYFLSGKKKTRRPKVIIFRDTSGSMYNEKIQQDLANEILSINSIGSVWVGDVDTRVHQIYEIKNKNDLRPPKGGGGTSFVKAFEEAKKIQADIVIYLTDTYGDFPNKKDVGKFAQHTVWVTFDDNSDVQSTLPFGRHVNITTT